MVLHDEGSIALMLENFQVALHSGAAVEL